MAEFDEIGGFLGGHAEHVGDDEHRQPDRDAIDIVECFAARRREHQILGDPREGFGSPLDHRARQAGHDDRAQPRMERAVAVVDARRAMPFGAAILDCVPCPEMKSWPSRAAAEISA